MLEFLFNAFLLGIGLSLATAVLAVSFYAVVFVIAFIGSLFAGKS